MAKTLEALRAKLRIDEHALEVVLREHPEIVYEVGSELALAVSNRDEAKQDLEELEALVDKEIRADAAANDEKITETGVVSQKKLDKRVIAANDKFLAERYNAAQWAVLKDAFEQRSYAISKLVDLYLANYYSTIEKKSDVDYRTVRSQQIKDHNREARTPRATRVAP